MLPKGLITYTGMCLRYPEPYIPKGGGQDYEPAGPGEEDVQIRRKSQCLYLPIDEPDVIMRKFRRAVTDSEATVRYDEKNKPGISNLMSIYSSITGKSYEVIEKEFEDLGYGDFKTAVGQTVVDTLKPIQEKHDQLDGG